MPNFSPPSCLLVDDDAFMLKIVSRQLTKLGIDNFQCSDNAHDALRIIANRSNPIQVVITDLNMPGMDGIQLLRKLGSLGFSVAVILISGEDPRLLDSVQNLAKQYQLDVLGSISKPIQTDTLSELLSRYLPQQNQPNNGPGAMVFADELHHAIFNGDLQVHYQPQICIKDKRLIGLEALARWKHPEKGPIPPVTFIGIAEKHGMIAELTESIFTQATRQFGQWLKLGFNISLSVNFSAQALGHLELPELLSETLKTTGIPHEKLIIELTESAVAQDTSITLDILTRLRLKGFGLSIDDFGTGFSSLEQLKQIPFTELKIDRSFVHDAAQNQASRAILESSIGLAQRLNIQCVAEGVETQEDWNIVETMGCDIMQGYFTAKPMPADDFMNWVKHYHFKP